MSGAAGVRPPRKVEGLDAEHDRHLETRDDVFALVVVLDEIFDLVPPAAHGSALGEKEPRAWPAVAGEAPAHARAEAMRGDGLEIRR